MSDVSLDIIHHGNCIEVMKQLPDGCIDLVFADPPYNLQLKQTLLRPNQSKVAGVNDHWDQFSSFEQYDAFTKAWLSECRRVLKETGTLWVIGTYHNIFRVGSILQDLGYWVLNDVVWIKTNPMPNFRGRRFCNAHETLIWAKRSEDQLSYTFNYQSLKAGNEDLQMRSDWYLPLCGGAERLREGSGKLHATQKPEGLIHRIIRGCTHPGDTVLDPFFGSGTTGAIAKELDRRFIGIEREEAYIHAARTRLAAVRKPRREALDTFDPNSKRRVPFVSLIELGLIGPGARVRLGSSEIFAVVRVDGMLDMNGETGSIHRLGAKLLGKQACNGWEHWMREDDLTGEFRPIDHLREQARKMLYAPIELEDLQKA